MNNLERATSYNTVDIIDYVPDTLAMGKIVSKTTGSVTIVASDAGVKVEEKISPFDTLVHILDGAVEVTIDHKCHALKAGQCIILPAHFRSRITTKTRYKMLLTVIKSGYEDTI